MKTRQIVAAAVAFLLLLGLASCKRWPFHQLAVDLGENPSIWEILINDRITLGLIRAGLAAVVTYAVVSIPALIVGGRWMKGLTTAGLTADDADSADEGIEELQQELKATQDELQDQVTQNDLLAQILLEFEAGEETGPPDEGGA